MLDCPERRKIRTGFLPGAPFSAAGRLAGNIDIAAMSARHVTSPPAGLWRNLLEG